MIAHLVLFRPHAHLATADLEAFAFSLERALTEIPVVRRAVVGRRRKLDRYYDRANALDFTYVAILEFDSETDLQTYLDHEAHRDLGERFYQVSEIGLAADFELLEAKEVRKLLVHA